MHDGRSSSQHLRVILFAGMVEAAGRRDILVPWEQGTLAELRGHLAQACPEIGPLLASSGVAIGDRFMRDDETVLAGQTVAIIPPVSGG